MKTFTSGVTDLQSRAFAARTQLDRPMYGLAEGDNRAIAELSGVVVDLSDLVVQLTQRIDALENDRE